MRPAGPRIAMSTHDHHLDGRPRAADAACAGFAHEALLYAGLDGFMEAIVPFVRDGLAAGESALVAVAGERLEALREELWDAEGLWLVDMAEMGRNPARIIGHWRDFVAQRGGAGPLRGVGEPIWAGRAPDELVECQRHESLINLAFAEVSDFRLICPYDVAALPEEVVVEARRSHPILLEGGTRRLSESFAAPAALLPAEDDLPAPWIPVEPMAFGRDDVSGLRRLVAARAAEAGVPADRVSDLTLAVSEVATNSILHGGGGGTLATWTEPGAFVCEIRDAGRLADPLVGRARPDRGQRSGRGMWLVNEVCDLVQVRALEGGTVVRLHVGVPMGR